ncbi:MAG: PLDc N-terminal domain-containing protein [Deltaproteobacteria bacterium]|nr:PLDc N-terminal domain-containing protein [Deltaproteobacteria bacterium]
MIQDINTFLFIAGTGLIFFILTALAILDVASKDFGDVYKKAAWGFIAFIPFVGCIIYFLIGRNLGVKKNGSEF